jgi:hypothetical protein
MATPLNLDALVAEVAEMDTLVTSVVALLAGQAEAISKAVADALAADDAADQGSIDAAQVAIDGAVASFKAQGAKLAAAVAANTPPPVV